MYKFLNDFANDNFFSELSKDSVSKKYIPIFKRKDTYKRYFQ